MKISKFLKTVRLSLRSIPVQLESYCALCTNALPTHDSTQRGFCNYCKPQFTHNVNCCRQCAIPFTEHLHGASRCGNCIKQPPSFDRAITSFLYTYPLDRLISAFKYHGRTELIYFLSLEMLKDLKIYYSEQEQLPDCLIPVPLHMWREYRRGFNQAHLLAKHLSRGLYRPVRNDILIRSRSTAMQSALKKDERYTNLKNAFKLSKSFIGPLPEYVALVDDVMTTGSTLNQTSKILKQAGVKKIDVWCLARAEI